MASLLSTKEFLTAIWPSEGPYCLATPFNKDGKEVFAHRSFDEIDDAIAASLSMCHVEKKHVFFCVHSLVHGKKLNPNTGKLKTYRTHDNMKEGKAFFFDLDVGESEPKKPKKYATQQEAWNGLDQFLFRSCLPAPYVVSSGGGLHVYWVVDEPIPSVEWRKQADKLRFIAQQIGLRFDPMRTTDQSSVLRVPGTVNYKEHVQAPVRVHRVGTVTPTAKLIAQFDKLAGKEYMPLAPLVRTFEEGTSAASFQGRLTPADEVFEACEVMREFRDKQGVVPEPHWYAACGTLMWTEEGKALVHLISSGDPRYDEGETETKILQWEKLGPPTCSKIKLDVGSDACDRCPFSKKGRNPLDIANKLWTESVKPQPALQLKPAAIKAPEVHLTQVSLPFVRINGGVGIMKQDKEDPMLSVTVRFLAYDLFPIENFEGNAQEPGFSRWVVELPLEGQRVFTFENNNFASVQTFSQGLLNVGIFVPDANEMTLVRRYMLHYLRDLQRFTKAQATYDHLGWVYNDDTPEADGDPLRFVLNGKSYEVGALDVEPCAMSSGTEFVKEFIKTRGTLQDQVALLDFYQNDFYLPHQFVTMCSLGAVLFRGTGQDGVIVSIWGETGKSKSTALYTGASFWGDFKRYVINGTPDGATVRARDDMVMAFANMPVFVDEITLFEPGDARRFVMTSTQPGGRISLTNDRKQRKHRGGVKSTIIVCSANNSLQQLVNTSTTAGQAGTVRVLEIEVEGTLPHSKVEANKFLYDLSRNFGHIGPEFLRHVVPVLPKVDFKLREEMNRIETRFNIKPEERFYSASGASALTAGRIAAKLNLHPFNMDHMEEWFGDVLMPRMRSRVAGEIARTQPHEILGNFIDAINGETLKINLDAEGELAGILHVPHGQISARLDIAAKELWVRTDRFGEFCTRFGHNRERIAKACMTSRLIKGIERRTLTKGLGEGQETLRTTCYVIDLAHRQARDLPKE